MWTSIRSSVLLVALVAAPAIAQAQETDTPTLDPLRERFREGMAQYRAGAYAEAIVIWEAVYRDLGAAKGYRLAFNLGRAYDQFGDTTRAAEHYETYVKEASARRDAGEALEALVEKQVVEANERLAELARTAGRIRIAGDRAVVLRIDGGTERLASRGSVAYVAPGRHVLTFDPNEARSQRVEVAVSAGDVLDVTPPVVVAPPPPPPITYELRRMPPFSQGVLFVAGGVAVASAAIPLAYFAAATSTRSDYDANPTQGLRDDYAHQKDVSYATWAIPAVLGAATLGLAAWWLWGGKTKRVPVVGLAY